MPLARTSSSSSHYHITYKDSSTWATPHLLKYHMPPNKMDTSLFMTVLKKQYSAYTTPVKVRYNKTMYRIFR